MSLSIFQEEFGVILLQLLAVYIIRLPAILQDSSVDHICEGLVRVKFKNSSSSFGIEEVHTSSEKRLVSK